ncbi:hypothetical protein LCGC14_1290440 [marine sediment metagenome]|uniref:Uncharacterized protein n=1 Tax=marine sediment metagenome TaxID=412755 RepID=A0A0F9LDJ7_9ZZZZ
MLVEGVKLTEFRLIFPSGIFETSQITMQLPLHLRNLLVKPFARRRHFKVNADFLVLDVDVSKLFFKEILNEIKEKEKNYKGIWRVSKVYFPNIFIEVLSTNGASLFIISLNFRNYDYWPPQVGFLSPNEKLIIKFKADAVIPDDQGKHLIANGSGVWVCLPGSFEYHNFYFDDRWELEKSNFNIIDLINRVINMVDRTKENVIEVAPK